MIGKVIKVTWTRLVLLGLTCTVAQAVEKIIGMHQPLIDYKELLEFMK